MPPEDQGVRCVMAIQCSDTMHHQWRAAYQCADCGLSASVLAVVVGQGAQSRMPPMSAPHSSVTDTLAEGARPPIQFHIVDF